MLNGLRTWQKDPRSCSGAVACITVKNKKRRGGGGGHRNQGSNLFY